MSLCPVNGVQKVNMPVEKLPYVLMLMATAGHTVKKAGNPTNHVRAVCGNPQPAGGQFQSLAHSTELGPLRGLGVP